MSADLHGIIIAPEIGWGGGVQFVDLFLRRAVGRCRQGGPSAHPLTGCVMLAIGLLITPSKILILHGNGSKERRAGVGQRRAGGIAVFPFSAARSLLVVADRIFRLNSLAAAPVTNPPSMTNSEPVMKLDSSDARNSASFATSSASPARPIGVRSIKAFTRVCRPCKNGVSIAPGIRLGSASLESVEMSARRKQRRKNEKASLRPIPGWPQ